MSAASGLSAARAPTDKPSRGERDAGWTPERRSAVPTTRRRFPDICPRLYPRPQTPEQQHGGGALRRFFRAGEYATVEARPGVDIGPLDPSEAARLDRMNARESRE